MSCLESSNVAHYFQGVRLLDYIFLKIDLISCITPKKSKIAHENWQQTFHSMVMTESGEELKLVGGGEFFTVI